MMVEAYLRRGRRRMEQLLLEPGIRGLLLALFYGGSGFLLTAASLGNSPQPIAMGMICGFTGWRAVLITLGALAGYPTFWGSGGLQGIAWAASAGLLALLLGRREESRNQPLMIPAIAAFLTAITGLCFQLLLRDRTPPLVYGLRIGLTGLTAMLFTQAVRCRDPVTDWLIGAAALLPARTQIPRRRGETGAAQVRLEVGAEMFFSLRQLLTETEPPAVDAKALLERAQERACGTCSARNRCTQRLSLSLEHLEHPLEADCRKQGRLIPQLRLAQEQRRGLEANRKRLLEYRQALAQQYTFLGEYLRNLADGLPRKARHPLPEFQAQAAARSRGKERANGDRCVAFPGTGCRYYVLLCDGMGTGLGAAQAGFTAAGLLRQMLAAGFPAGDALETLNSLLTLRGSAGEVTVDLAEVQLDTGIASLFKWGAAPSWLLTRRGTEKIGTATPPPGLSLEENRMTVEKLSLRRGEVLILVSDGVDGEGIQHQSVLSPDAPPGELAAEILDRGCVGAEDDATVAVIRLRPVSLPTG